jgi:hypothetical protein
MSVNPDLKALLEQSYAAFNAKDIDAVLATMHTEVDWPDMLGNRRIVGHEAVREYLVWPVRFHGPERHSDGILRGRRRQHRR